MFVKVGHEGSAFRKMQSDRNLGDYTLAHLKELLRGHGLNASGNKAELIKRIQEADPDGHWATESEDLPSGPRESISSRDDHGGMAQELEDMKQEQRCFV